VAVTWTAEVTEEFERWWDTLTEEERISVDGAIQVLEQRGPSIGDGLSSNGPGSRYVGIRQLRVPHDGHEICVLYFPDDARSTLILLTGTTATEPNGDCPSDQVALADAIYEVYSTRRQRH
jgi:hypothetical protein